MSPLRPVRRRKIVPEIAEVAAADGLVAAPGDRVLPRGRITYAEEEIAVLVGITGNLHSVAWATGRTLGSVKNVVHDVAAKLVGTLPAMPRVAVWVRGGDEQALGVRVTRRIPEHLLRPDWVGEDAGTAFVSPPLWRDPRDARFSRPLP